MEVIKGNKNLKGTTVNDILYPTNKDQIFFQDTTTSTEKVDYITKQGEAMVQNAVTELEKRKNYNANLRNLDPDYTKLTPLNSYIVRLAIVEDEITKSNIILPKLVNVKAERKSGQGYDEIPDPFRFKSTAVIVSVPKYETTIKPGMLVQIAHFNMLTTSDEVVGYEYNYAHPDYNDKIIPRQPDHKHFGYAILPQQMIKVIIDEA